MNFLFFVVCLLGITLSSPASSSTIKHSLTTPSIKEGQSSKFSLGTIFESNEKEDRIKFEKRNLNHDFSTFNSEGVRNRISFLSPQEEASFKENRMTQKKDIKLKRVEVRDGVVLYTTPIYVLSGQSPYTFLSVYSVLLYSSLQRTYFLDCTHFPSSSYPTIKCYNHSSPNSLFQFCPECDIGDYCRVAKDALTLDPSLYPSSLYSFCISSFSVLYFEDWESFDGILGIAYPSDYPKMSGFSDLLPLDWPRIVGLSLKSHGSSYLSLGGYTLPPRCLSHSDPTCIELTDGDIEWSEKQCTYSPTYHQFPMFHLRICSQNLFPPSTSQYLARISTSTSCLGLPETLYYSVMGWINGINCRIDESKCEYNDSLFDPERLPFLSFQLSETSKDLYLPLKNLLLSSTVQPLCIENLGLEAEAILLGTIVLESFYTILDMEQYRVGFVPSQTNQVKPNDECELAPIKECSGGEDYNEQSNTCEDPNCALYFFQVVDPDSKTCRWSVSFQVFITTILVGLSVIELLLNQYYTQTTNSILAILPNQD